MRDGLVVLLLISVAMPALADSREAIAILQRSCYECHGPEKQRGGLRLDSREASLQGGDSGPAIVPGRPEKSDILRRVALPAGSEGAMPPRGQRLRPAEIDLLRTWIMQEADWPRGARKHWAYIPPTRPKLPQVSAVLPVRNPIDAFIFSRLEKEGIMPAPEAAKETLIRRLYLDLTGLPPAPQEVDAFLQDTSATAYHKLVDRLLAFPHFGVKWARPWLDAARYADSHGFQRDDFRDIWAYRDWVGQRTQSRYAFRPLQHRATRRGFTAEPDARAEDRYWF